MNALEYDPKNNRLFFALAAHGLGVYHLDNDSFQEFSLGPPNELFPSENHITDIALGTNSSELYLGTMAGVLILDLDSWTVSKKDESAGLPSNYVWHLALDELSGRLFIGTDDGFSILFTANYTFIDKSRIPAYLRQGYVGEMAFNTKTNILYLARADKLYSYNLSANTLKKLFQSGEAFGPSSIDSLAFDEQTECLFLGCHGITIFNISSQTVIANYNEKDGMQSHVVEAIYFTPACGGLVFASQQYNGLAVFNCSSGELSFVRREEGLLSNDVGSLAMITHSMDSNDLCLATAALLRKHHSYNNHCYYPKQSKNAARNAITANSSCPLLVIGVRGALVLYQIKEGIINKTIVINFDLPTSNVWELMLNSDNTRLFIGADEYLCIFDLTTKQFTNYDYVSGLPRAFITTTIQDTVNDRLFIATTGG